MVNHQAVSQLSAPLALIYGADPRLTGSKPVVLPLHHISIKRIQAFHISHNSQGILPLPFSNHCRRLALISDFPKGVLFVPATYGGHVTVSTQHQNQTLHFARLELAHCLPSFSVNVAFPQASSVYKGDFHPAASD